MKKELLRPFLAVVTVFACVSSSRAEKQDWLPVSQQEKQIAEVPGKPGASAIQLYYYQSIDDAEANNEAEYIYRRIKVLNEKGNKYADVEIVVPPGFHLLDLKARTIHADGKIFEFQGKPFDKTIARGRGFRVAGKSFTLPEVTPGSIIEYRYKLDYPPNEIPLHAWNVQHDLYTLKEYFRMRAYTGPIKGVEGGTGISLSFNLPAGVRPESKGESYELKMEKVPAFEEEAYMPPQRHYMYYVRFFYGGREVMSVDKFWRRTGVAWSDEAESFIGNLKAVKEAAAEAIAGQASPEKQLRKLYARAQQVRNLTYERERNSDEQKRENLRPNRSAAEVLSQGYGTREDITYLFIALARAAGFDAAPVRTGNRDDALFQKNVIDAGQLEGQVALVNLEGRDLFLDPGTRFCPFGELRWIRTSTEGLKLDRNSPVFVPLPGAGPDKAVIERSANVTLRPDGSLQGELAVVYRGTEALERRIAALETDDSGRNKSLEDEVKEWLPSGASVKLKKAVGWEGTEEPLHAEFAIEVPSYASVAGKRVLVPVYLFATRQRDAFRHDERKYPVSFRYASSELDNVRMKLAAGFTMENVPPAQDANLPYASYRSLVNFNGIELEVSRVLQLNVVICPLSKYGELRGFFNKVITGDELQAVFQGGIASAQKGN